MHQILFVPLGDAPDIWAATLTHAGRSVAAVLHAGSDGYWRYTIAGDRPLVAELGRRYTSPAVACSHATVALAVAVALDPDTVEWARKVHTTNGAHRA